MAAAVKFEFSSLDAMKSLVPVCHHLFTKHLHLCILQMRKGFAMQNDAKFLFFEHCSPIKFLSQLALVLSIILVIFLFALAAKPSSSPSASLSSMVLLFSSILFSQTLVFCCWSPLFLQYLVFFRWSPLLFPFSCLYLLLVPTSFFLLLSCLPLVPTFSSSKFNYYYLSSSLFLSPVPFLQSCFSIYGKLGQGKPARL